MTQKQFGRVRRGVLFLAAVFFIFSGLLWADELRLGSGDLIEGIVTGETPDGYAVQVEDGVIEFKRAEVMRVRLMSEAENAALRERWKELAKRKREDASHGVKVGKFLSIPFSNKEGMAKWFRTNHSAVHSQLAQFPLSAYFMNLKPVATYRREHPALYVMAFYSALLIAITPVVALLRNMFYTALNAQRRKMGKKELDH